MGDPFDQTAPLRWPASDRARSAVADLHCSSANLSTHMHTHHQNQLQASAIVAWGHRVRHRSTETMSGDDHDHDHHGPHADPPSFPIQVGPCACVPCQSIDRADGSIDSSLISIDRPIDKTPTHAPVRIHHRPSPPSSASSSPSSPTTSATIPPSPTPRSTPPRSQRRAPGGSA